MLESDNPAKNAFQQIVYNHRYQGFGGDSLSTFEPIATADLILGKEASGLPAYVELFVQTCLRTDEKLRELVPRLASNDPTQNRYFYDFLEDKGGLQEAAGQGTIGKAVDATTLVVNDGFLRDESTEFQTGYEDYDFYRNTMKRTTDLNMRISHERIHQITFGNEKLLAAADPSNITAVTDLNAQILALAPVEVQVFELKTAKPLGVQIISGVALVSYFETAEGIKTATIGDATNELFTNHLAQGLTEPNQLTHPLLQKLIDTVGSYEDTVRLYLHSDFLKLQAKYEALHGTGSYLAFLKAVDDLNTIADNLDLARQYGEDKAAAKRYEQFKNKLEEILSS